MKKITLLFGFLFIYFQSTYAQELPQKEATLFTCIEKNDTIQFIRFSADTIQPRPTLLYCQGSLPYPLFVTEGQDSWIIAMDVFDYNKILERFNIILISMPHTPIVTKFEQLNNRSEYVPNISKPDIYDNGYVKSNYLEKYVERGNVVLNFLREQKWVDKKRLFLLGHSQGAHVAAHLAFQNPDICALGYFSGNPMGRFAQLIREKRILSNRGVISPEKAQYEIEGLYTKWREICGGQLNNIGGDTNQTWMSFSKIYIDEMLNLNMPIFVAYGTEDPGAQLCDLLPVYFDLKGKKNYKMYPLIGRGHNFETIDVDGRHNYEDMHWQEAIDNFISWTDEL